MSNKEKVTDFPTVCQVCKELIEDQMLFYSHPRLGYVCENCPEFEDGGIISDE